MGKIGSLMITCCLVMMAVIVLRWSESFAQWLSYFDNQSPSLTTNLQDVVQTSDITEPFRDGTYLPVESPDGTHSTDVIINIGRILSFDEAQNQTLRLIKNIINYALSFVMLIVFLFLLYEWYMIVTAANDDEQYQKALSKLKTASIAVAGIAISRLIVSFIIAVVDQLL